MLKILDKLQTSLQNLFLLGVLTSGSVSNGDISDKDKNKKNINNSASLIMSSFVINILALALPIMTLQIYDRILPNHSEGTLFVLALGVGIAIFLDALLRLTRSYLIHWAGASYEHAIACNTIRHMLASDLSMLEKETIGQQVQRVECVSALRDFFSGQALITLVDFPFVLIFIFLIGYLAGWLVLVPITLLIIFIGVALYLGKNLKKALHHREQVDDEKTEFLAESLEGIHTIKALGMESILQRQYEQLQAASSLENYQVVQRGNLAGNYSALLSHAMSIGIIALGAPMAMRGDITLGTLVACILLSGRIMNPLQQALSVWQRFQNVQLARNSLEETFHIPVVPRLDPEMLNNYDGKLEFKDLRFSYNSASSPSLFDKINLTLKPGDSISLSGDHSCGKTTLLKLAAGLYKPLSGKVLLDGADATSYPARELVRHIAFLPMEGAIFRGTIRENLTAFGEIPEDKMFDILHLLEIESEISCLPSGFETRLEGNSADPVPPGVKQRIAIARALALKPHIILFDNADRGLDKEGYASVHQLLARLKGKVTMVIASNDDNICNIANTHYVLANGKLVQKDEVSSSIIHDIGTYRELRS